MALITAAIGFGIMGVADPASAGTYQGGVNMQSACDTQYPGWGTRATVLNQSDAYSWRCVAGNGSAYSINVNLACRSQYGGGSYAGLGSSTNPYSWYCQYAGCYGASCVHVDPGATDCGGVNSASIETVTVPGGGAQVALKWSDICHANWTRWVSGVSDPAYWNYWVETSDGHREYKTFNQSAWTFMVNGNLLARSCIQGNWDPTPACTGWH